MATIEATNPSDSSNDQSAQPIFDSNNNPIPSNPYFLNCSENPGSILVTQPLLGLKNYHSWARIMVLALTAKKKIGFVNGKIPMPDLDSPLYKDWQSCKTMFLSWMINSMQIDVSSSIMY